MYLYNQLYLYKRYFTFKCSLIQLAIKCKNVVIFFFYNGFQVVQDPFKFLMFIELIVFISIVIFIVAFLIRYLIFVFIMFRMSHVNLHVDSLVFETYSQPKYFFVATLTTVLMDKNN